MPVSRVVDSMDNVKDFYIIGLPIDTEIGKLYPTLMEDYPTLLKYLGVLTLEKDDLIISLSAIAKENDGFQPLVDYAKDVSLFEFAITFKGEDYKGTFIQDIYIQFKELFKFCFKDDVFDKIQDNEEFEYYIQLIKDVNDVQYEKPNPNPEIARFDRLKKKLQDMKGETVTFEAMYSSVLLSSGIHPNKMTIYQFNKAFDRIGHFKSYDTTTLFKTVDTSGKLDVHPWYSMTKKEEPSLITEEQLNKAREQMSKGGLQSDL